jgi:hypothetical protein
MIRTIASYFLLRSIDRSRPVPWPLRSLVAASGPLAQLERDLRALDGALRSSTSGLVAPPPPWLAPRTISKLPPRSDGGQPRRLLRGRFAAVVAIIGGVAGVGGLVAAAVLALSLLRVESSTLAEPAGPIASGADTVPEASSSTLVAAMLQPRDRVAIADSLANPLLAEAQRLRDDTQAAASFLLDRLRIIGVQTSQ